MGRIGSAACAALMCLILGGAAEAAPKTADYAPDLEPAVGAIRPGEVRAQFMGVSTILLDDGQTQILLDGFFTRPAWPTVALAMRPNLGKIGRGLDRAGVTRLGAVLVAHAHHDHVLDAPDVAMSAGRFTPGRPPVLAGSESVRFVAEGRGYPVDDPARFWLIGKGRMSREIGDFTITAYETPHSPGGPAREEIKTRVPRDAPALAYQMGPNFSYMVIHKNGLRVLLYPSANVPDVSFAALKPHVVFLGVARLGDQPPSVTDLYWKRVVFDASATPAPLTSQHKPLVIPVHWDDFGSFRPELSILGWPFDNAAGSLKLVARRACQDQVTVRFASVFQPVTLWADGAPMSGRAPGEAPTPAAICQRVGPPPG
ncbi:MBL fold metallo-hydrolase [Phenylobacterium sp.]|uniref:MBL fold metallo-hydrolase n=1 Tax=Phenylobacterium sp. TaxID=1871053 RepID=UPI0025D4DC59|nr:MBL fold metallo-hydrolase [Phenylobacterium sp.]